MNPQRLLLVLLFSLLAILAGGYWLTIRPAYTTPDGAAVYGPVEERSDRSNTLTSAMNHTLTFTVRQAENRQPDKDYLHNLAHMAVPSGNGETGHYTIRFVDQTTGQLIGSWGFSSAGDLLGTTKVAEDGYY